MARIIVKAKYYTVGKRNNIAGYANYIATREGVEKIDDTKLDGKPSKSQEALIKKILNDFPDSTELIEYDDYREKPTIRTATEFISRCLEENAMGLKGKKTYADYIATRPRAEKIGTHGLFSDAGTAVNLSKVDEELNGYGGRVFTFIISLHREDAARLGFDNASRWMDMSRAHAQEIAESLRIPYTNLKWYAAFHNEGTHPHIHLMAYSKDSKEGYLTKKGIDDLRSSFANDIFADELHNLFAEQTEVRDNLKNDWKTLVAEAIAAIGSDMSSHSELEQKLILLAEKLRNTGGKKVYGYLKKDVKELIDSIVDLLAEDENIAKLYDLWWEKKCAVLETYYRDIPYQKPPLSQNKEFKSLKNDIIREAIGNHSAPVQKVSATAVTGLLRSLAATFRDKIHREDKKIAYTDKRQKREEEQKRNAEFDFIM